MHMRKCANLMQSTFFLRRKGFFLLVNGKLLYTLFLQMLTIELY